MMTMLAAIARDESGQDLIEYALLAWPGLARGGRCGGQRRQPVNVVWLGVDSQIGSIPAP